MCDYRNHDVQHNLVFKFKLVAILFHNYSDVSIRLQKCGLSCELNTHTKLLSCPSVCPIQELFQIESTINTLIMTHFKINVRFIQFRHFYFQKVKGRHCNVLLQHILSSLFCSRGGGGGDRDHLPSTAGRGAPPRGTGSNSLKWDPQMCLMQILNI